MNPLPDSSPVSFYPILSVKIFYTIKDFGDLGVNGFQLDLSRREVDEGEFIHCWLTY